MEYFSINAFILGTLLFGCLFLSNIIFTLLCVFSKTKIIKFSLFLDPWFSLHSESIMGTKFSLGWLPLGGYIKPLGMTTDEEEKKKISPDELPYALFNKSNILQTIFHFVPCFIYLFALLFSVILLSNSNNILSELKIIGSYLVSAFTTMFSDNSAKEQFILTTKQITSDKNVVIFGFTLLSIVMLLFTPITPIINWFSNDEKNKSKIQKVIGYVVTILIYWFILWKIPKFVFSFFTLSQSIIFISSFSIGILSSGVVFYFATLFVVKNISQNLSDNKLK